LIGLIDVGSRLIHLDHRPHPQWSGGSRGVVVQTELYLIVR